VKRLLILTLAFTAAAQTSKPGCDADLVRQTNPKDADRYMDRGGRCEGLYAEQVSGSFGNLLVESLTQGIVMPSVWTGALTVQCKYKEPVDVHIQAFLLQPRPFYRLDAIERGSTVSWSWDTEIISRYAKPANVGLVAWTSTMVDGRPQRVYLPVRSPTGQNNEMKLIVVPPVAVSEAYVTIAGTAPGERPVRQRTPVGKGSYLRNQRIEIDIPALPHEGLYRVEVTGSGEVRRVAERIFRDYAADLQFDFSRKRQSADDRKRNEITTYREISALPLNVPPQRRSEMEPARQCGPRFEAGAG
jgi:hypothetical protein